MSPAVRRPLSLPLPNAGQRVDFPVPIQPQDVVEVFVTPSPPSNTRLSPPFPPRQQSANLHLDIVADLAKGPTGITHPEIVDPSSERGVDLLHQFRHRGCTPTSNDVADLCFDCRAGLLLRG